MMQGPSPKSQSAPSMSTQSVKVAPALICTTRSRATGAAEPTPSEQDQAPRPRAEKGRQPKVQTRPRSVRTTACASPTAMSTATSSGGSMERGSSEKPLVAPESERPGRRQTKQRPSQLSATLKLAPRSTLRAGGSSGGSCSPAPGSWPSSEPGAVQPPASCSSVAESAAVIAPTPSEASGSDALLSEDTAEGGSVPELPRLALGPRACARHCGRSRAVARDFTRPLTRPMTASSCGAGGSTSRPQTYTLPPNVATAL
mmetsp:Transcript_14327/g.39301  ORF Transcript_14327/g.39301 Transcript_14327/m.39301 type:complete len:258 (+) Transcript_14327:386-1159(+)